MMTNHMHMVETHPIDYALLLRGINVGGHRRVPMASLKTQLAQAGLTNIVSYINSGNLIFTSTSDPTARVTAVLQTNYEFDIPFVLIDGPSYLKLATLVPSWWGVDPQMRHNTLFKMPGYNDQFDELIQQKATLYDQISLTDQVIFWSSPSKVHYSRALYAKMLKEPYYPVVTIRNRNTTLKLAQLLKGRQK